MPEGLAALPQSSGELARRPPSPGQGRLGVLAPMEAGSSTLERLAQHRERLQDGENALIEALVARSKAIDSLSKVASATGDAQKRLQAVIDATSARNLDVTPLLRAIPDILGLLKTSIGAAGSLILEGVLDEIGKSAEAGRFDDQILTSIGQAGKFQRNLLEIESRRQEPSLLKETQSLSAAEIEGLEKRRGDLIAALEGENTAILESLKKSLESFTNLANDIEIRSGENEFKGLPKAAGLEFESAQILAQVSALQSVAELVPESDFAQEFQKRLSLDTVNRALAVARQAEDEAVARFAPLSDFREEALSRGAECLERKGCSSIAQGCSRRSFRSAKASARRWALVCRAVFRKKMRAAWSGPRRTRPPRSASDPAASFSSG